MIPVAAVVEALCQVELSSPNQGMRIGGRGIRLIILHATADKGNERGAEEWMCNPKAEASAHIHIRRDGTIVRLVPDKRRAWHAGVSSWPGVRDVNSESLGWEIANRNDGNEPYTNAQYVAVAELLAFYLPQGIAREDVLSHAQIAPGRKSDPRGWHWTRMWREVDALTLPTIREIRPAIVAIPRPPAALDLRQIPVPTPDHVAETFRVRRLDPKVARPVVAAIEAMTRGVVAGQPVGMKRDVAKALADALSGWLNREGLPPAPWIQR